MIFHVQVFLVYLFGRTDALLQGFLVLLRSILSEPGDEKTCLRCFWPVKIQSGLLSSDVSWKPEISDI